VHLAEYLLAIVAYKGGLVTILQLLLMLMRS